MRRGGNAPTRPPRRADGSAELGIRQLVLRSLVVVAAMAALYFLLYPFRDAIVDASRWITERLGYLGVFVYVFAVDSLILPASLDVLLLFTERLAPVPLLSVMSAASIAGGLSGYGIGRFLGRLRFIGRLTAGYRARGEAMLRRYGGWAIVIAAVTPLPFSTVSWIAGMLRLDIRLYVAGALARIPRIAAAYALIRFGGALMRRLLTGW